ncbi:uncharacterized protein [Maniola hyperantus]|uniref:uncharacterized protein n=1 Tax=Aphantopus hyperantus TaxID=2795564 RepID=UPI003749BAE5
MHDDPLHVPPDPGEYVEVQTTPLPSTSVPQAGRKRPSDESPPSAAKKPIPDPATAHPSVQSIYTHPSLSEAPSKYLETDSGPFIVYVSRAVADPSAGTALRAIKFGQFLFKNKIRSIVNDGVKSVGRNKVSVEFSCAEAASSFLTNPVIEAAEFKAYIPTFNVTRMGMVRGVPVDWHLDEFVESLELPSGCGEVLKARRLNRKQVVDGVVAWIPTQSVVVTFRGQMLPAKVYSYHTSLPVETYIFPTIQCLNCCRFGHIKTQCRSKPRCFKCTQPHTGDSCETTPDNAMCVLCTGKHLATDKSCPEHNRQQAIKKAMSQDNISYSEASSRFPPSRPSYAEMTKQMFAPPTYTPRPSPKTPSQHNTTSPRSYRETITRSPRPRAPVAKGYDRRAHQNIIGTPPSSVNNGSAINNNDQGFTHNTSDNDNLISILTKSLVNIIENFNNQTSPPNAAQILFKIVSLLQNGLSENNAMEL